jgi:hypothetical protein
VAPPNDSSNRDEQLCYWRIEVELHARNVLVVVPKTDDFVGKLENHEQPRFPECGNAFVTAKDLQVGDRVVIHAVLMKGGMLIANNVQIGIARS